MNYEYDVIVIGGGAAGLTASKTAAGLGKKVALIEKKDVLGGECTWIGCVPSKAFIKSAQVVHHINHAKDFGLKVDATIDTNQLFPFVRSVVREVYQTHTPEKIKSFGIDVLYGNFSFIDAHTIALDDKNITAKKFIISTGSEPFIPEIEGLDSVSYLTNKNIFDLEQLPHSLLILGGGAVGTEMASAFARLGVIVTLVEMQKCILIKEDMQLVDMLVEQLRADGVIIRTQWRVAKVVQTDKEIVATCVDEDGQEHALKAEKLLVSVGRTPAIQGLKLESIGIKIHKKGIVVDSQLRTTVKNIYACGDVVGPYQFSHMAWQQAVIAARNACIPLFKKHINYSHKLWITFIASELASVGMTESQAREHCGNSIQIFTRFYDSIDRAHTDRTLYGMLKVIVDKKGYILGAHVFGERAGDIIHELQIAKVKKIKFYQLHDVVHAYPSYAELIWHLSKQAYLQRLQNNIFVKIAKMLFFKK